MASAGSEEPDEYTEEELMQMSMAEAEHRMDSDERDLSWQAMIEDAKEGFDEAAWKAVLKADARSERVHLEEAQLTRRLHIKVMEGWPTTLKL